MSKLVTLNGSNDHELLSSIFDNEIVVFEDIQGSKIWVNWDGKEFTIKPKSIGSESINLIDLAMQNYYNPAIKFFESLDIRVKSLLNRKWWFCFEYFPDNTLIFVDECHRTQAGVMHKAMKEIMPTATLIGFTGTPLLRTDKTMTIAQFGPYIHTYKFDEAVFDEVIVDLRYEARDIEQRISEQEKIDQWFAAKTAALTDIAKAELKKKWGTMQQVLSSRSRLNQIVADIVFDMETRPRLMSGRGNALLVASSITEACIYYDLFQKTPLKGKCGVVTSYNPTIRDLVGEDAGEGETLAIEQFNIYKKMLADYFNDPSETVINRAEEYEKAAKKKSAPKKAAKKVVKKKKK